MQVVIIIKSNKKLIIISVISGIVASYAATNVDGWISALLLAAVIGLAIGLIGVKILPGE